MEPSSTRNSQLYLNARMTYDWGKIIKLETDDEDLNQGFHIAEMLEKYGPRRLSSCDDCFFKPHRTFCTGSEYEGNYNSLGFNGFGTYVFPHGAVYEGNFRNGQFHGWGTIRYPKEQKISKAMWRKGKLISFVYEFKDGLMYKEPWNYCQSTDRRYRSEVISGLNPAGVEQLTNDVPTKKLLPNTYDTVDGYYWDETKTVYRDNQEFLRKVNKEEEQIIKTQYRFWKEEPVGYKPELYPKWTTGRTEEDEKKHSGSSNSYSIDSSSSETSDDTYD